MSADNVFPDGEPVGDGYMVSGEPDERMAAFKEDDGAGWLDAPAEPTPDPSEADLAASLGVDYEATSEWLTPEVEQELASRGLLNPEPQTDAELAANLLTTDGLRSKIEDQRAMADWEQAQAVAREQLAAHQLIEQYEAGDIDGTEMADYARTNLSPDAAAQVIQHWMADEEEYAEEPQSAIGYVEGLARQAREEQEWVAHLEQQAAQQAAAEHRASVLDAARGELERTLQQRPGTEQLLGKIRHLLTQIGPSIETADDAASAVRHAVAGAKELTRAEEVAGFLTSWDEDEAKRSGFMEPRQRFDRDETMARNLAHVLQPERGVHRSNADRNARAGSWLDEALFGEERTRAEGWGF